MNIHLKDIPNLISMTRIALVIPIVVALLLDSYFSALILFFVAGVSDGLDGYLAKHYGWVSRLGSILDPIADKLLLVSSFLVLAWLGHIPVWLVLTVIVRDIVIVVGASAFYFLMGHCEMMPTAISKLNTFAQLVLVFTVVTVLADVVALPGDVVDVLVDFVLVTTVLSGADYVWTWSQQAWRTKFKHTSR